MTIYLVRHGETAKNRDKRLQGRSNDPLNENGVRQACQVRDFFSSRQIPIHKVWSSPLIRAQQTAALIAGESVSIQTDDRLLEMDYGPYEGCSLENPPPEVIFFFQDFVHNPAPDGMEPLNHVVERMGHFLEEIRTDEPVNILISTHAIALKGALEYFTPDSGGAWWSRYLGNCSVFRIQSTETGFEIPEEVFSLSSSQG